MGISTDPAPIESTPLREIHQSSSGDEPQKPVPAEPDAEAEEPDRDEPMDIVVEESRERVQNMGLSNQDLGNDEIEEDYMEQRKIARQLARIRKNLNSDLVNPSPTLSRRRGNEELPKTEQEKRKRQYEMEQASEYEIDNPWKKLFRGTRPPIGLGYVPYQFATGDERKVAMQMDVYVPDISDEEISRIKSLRMKRWILRNPKEVQKGAKKDYWKKPPIGPNFQANVPEDLKTKPDDRNILMDKKVWSSLSNSQMLAALNLTADDIMKSGLDLGFLYNRIFHNHIWRAVLQQFNRRIPMEYVLETLMLESYSLAGCLDKVDKCLVWLPQLPRETTNGQIQMIGEIRNKTLKQEKKDKKLHKRPSRRWVQNFALRNFHISEVQHLVHDYHQEATYRPKYGVPCTCNVPELRQEDFEPRWSCKRCSRDHRDTSGYPEDQLCLICKTYKRLFNMDRPAEQVFLYSVEVTLIQTWNEMEMELNRKISRHEVLRLIQEENTDNWKNGRLTKEEMSQVVPELLPGKGNWTVPALPDPEKPKKPEPEPISWIDDVLTEKQLAKRFKNIAEQLQPANFFSNVPSGCPDRFENVEFSEIEQMEISSMLRLCKGNVGVAADLLGRNPLEVVKFVELFNKKHAIWKGKSMEFHNFPEVAARMAAQNMPKKKPNPTDLDPNNKFHETDDEV